MTRNKGLASFQHQSPGIHSPQLLNFSVSHYRLDFRFFEFHPSYIDFFTSFRGRSLEELKTNKLVQVRTWLLGGSVGGRLTYFPVQKYKLYNCKYHSGTHIFSLMHRKYYKLAKTIVMRYTTNNANHTELLHLFHVYMSVS